MKQTVRLLPEFDNIHEVWPRADKHLRGTPQRVVRTCR